MLFLLALLHGATGSLPEAWGADGSFPALQYMFVGWNKLTGTLPASYFGTTPFQNLAVIVLSYNTLVGSFPTASLSCSLCQPKVSLTDQSDFSRWAYYRWRWHGITIWSGQWLYGDNL